jgi:hypothetical protein
MIGCLALLSEEIIEKACSILPPLISDQADGDS